MDRVTTYAVSALFCIEAEAYIYALEILTLYNPALSNDYFIQKWYNIDKMVTHFGKHQRNLKTPP
jgi:hypothetical protein